MMGYYQQTDAQTEPSIVQRGDGKWLTRWGGWSIWRGDAVVFPSPVKAAEAAQAATRRLDWAIVSSASKAA